MFILLYRHNGDGVFDDFPTISDHFPKISEDPTKFVRRSHERCRAFSGDVQRLLKISEDFRRFPKILQNLSEGRANVAEHFTKMSEDY